MDERTSSIVKFLTTLATSLLLILVVVIVVQYVKIGKLRARAESIDEQIVQLDNERTNLDEGIESRKTQNFVEQEARDSLGLVKKGETVYIIK